jgi:hypothetical protein
MPESMTLEEAVRAVRDTAEHQHTQAVAFDVILTHAERTIAARSGEPSVVDLARAIAEANDGACLTHDELVELLYVFDTLTAERYAAREWAEQCQLERDTANDNAQNLLNEWQQLEAERDAAREEVRRADIATRWTAEEADRAFTDRDRLAACEERVRGVAEAYRSRDGGARAQRFASDILAALEGAHIAGVPIHVDPTMPDNVVELRGGNDVVRVELEGTNG